MLKNVSAQAQQFVGRGSSEDLSDVRPDWLRENRDPTADEFNSDHPAGYIAHPDLVDAVNTALLLRKPLLLTGRPGTGKSDVSERIAGEFGLGPVLRFEAQSLSEAQDLFYRFDLVGQMAEASLARANDVSAPRALRAERFITFGPLGKAILRAALFEHKDLWALAFGAHDNAIEHATASVVLIDEIDKAARDFPNDLLNGIQRLEFRIRELDNRLVKVPDDESLRPIVIITSNSERDLPEPFLRRCAYFHIPDPDEKTLREIVRSRVFPELRGKAGGADSHDAPVTPLPTLYENLLQFFVEFQGDTNRFTYTPGTTELIDWARALQRMKADPNKGIAENIRQVRAAVSAVAKSKADLEMLFEHLDGWSPKPA